MSLSLEDAMKNVETSGHIKKARRNLEEYFMGPQDVTRHSRWPRALRIHGSVTPKILVRTILTGIWAGGITTISEQVHPIHVHPIIVTILGILVGFSLHLRSSTAYERYMEGRKVWSSLNGVSVNLARNIWCHAKEREGELVKKDLLAKISFCNLIVAFAIALKHKVRFEPYTQYEDLYDLVVHLDTFAKAAGKPTERSNCPVTLRHIKHLFRLAEPNPRAELKQATRPLGNLPLEVLGYMEAYIQEIVDNGTFPLPSIQGKVASNIESLDGLLITWIYVITLPIQLVGLMGWVNVPVTIIAAYIIIGYAAIGNEIENPFGPEVNDLPLELYCAQIASDIAIITSHPPPQTEDYAFRPDNKLLYPICTTGRKHWADAEIVDIREALKTRALISKPAMWRRQSAVPSDLPLPIEREHSVDGSTLHGTAYDDPLGISEDTIVQWATREEYL